MRWLTANRGYMADRTKAEAGGEEDYWRSTWGWSALLEQCGADACVRREWWAIMIDGARLRMDRNLEERRPVNLQDRVYAIATARRGLRSARCSISSLPCPCASASQRTSLGTCRSGGC